MGSEQLERLDCPTSPEAHNLDGFLRWHRIRPDATGYAKIATRLAMITGVEVSHETVRRWCSTMETGGQQQ